MTPTLVLSRRPMPGRRNFHVGAHVAPLPPGLLGTCALLLQEGDQPLSDAELLSRLALYMCPGCDRFAEERAPCPHCGNPCTDPEGRLYSLRPGELYASRDVEQWTLEDGDVLVGDHLDPVSAHLESAGWAVRRAG